MGRNQHCRRAGVTSALGLLCLVSGFAADVEVPFYVNIEGSYKATGATLATPFESFEQPLHSWAPAEPLSKAFATLLKAITAGNAVTVAKLYSPLPAGGRRGAAIQPLTPKQFTETYRQTFSAMRPLGRVPVGPGAYLYLWQGDTRKGPMVRGFRCQAGPSALCSEVTSQTPFEAFLVNSFGRAPRGTWTPAGPGNSGRLELPLSTELRVRLLLPSGEARGERDQVANQLFTQFTTLARAGRFDELRGLLTPESTKRLMDWVHTVPAPDRAAFQNFLGERRRILRIGHLGSVALVFWAQSKLSTIQPEDLQFSYITWAGNTPQLANILSQSLFDDVLKQNRDVQRWAGVEGPPAAPGGEAQAPRGGK